MDGIEKIVLNKVNQTQKDKRRMFSPVVPSFRSSDVSTEPGVATETGKVGGAMAGGDEQ